MALYNPYRNFDKGMDDAYMGIEPSMQNSQQYMEGYLYSKGLMEDIEQEYYAVKMIFLLPANNPD